MIACVSVIWWSTAKKDETPCKQKNKWAEIEKFRCAAVWVRMQSELIHTCYKPVFICMCQTIPRLPGVLLKKKNSQRELVRCDRHSAIIIIEFSYRLKPYQMSHCAKIPNEETNVNKRNKQLCSLCVRAAESERVRVCVGSICFLVVGGDTD